MITPILGTGRRASLSGVQRVRPTSPYIDKMRRIFGGSLIEIWPGWESASAPYLSGQTKGINGNHGSVIYSDTPGYALPALGDQRGGIFYDGTGWSPVPISLIGSLFNGLEGTVSLWAQTDATGWAGTVAKRAMTIQTDATNRVLLQRTTTANQLNLYYHAGGVAKSLLYTVTPHTNWFHWAATWSKSADQVQAYYNGIAFGAVTTGLGTYAGSPLTFTLGSSTNTGPASPWFGGIARFALGNRALSAAEIAQLAVM